MKDSTRIKNAVYETDYKIRILFSDGKINVFNYKPAVKSDHQEWSQYLDVTKFKRFKIVDGGRSIAWGKNHEMNLAIDFLYHNRQFKPLTKKERKKLMKSLEKQYYRKPKKIVTR